MAQMISRAKSRAGAQRIHAFIAGAIAEGKLQPGDRLPTERELSRRFGAARSAARKTLAALEAQGRITRAVGRGTFVAGQDGETRDGFAAAHLRGVHVSPAELMEARLRFEPQLADWIVVNATAADFERMAGCLERAARATTLDEWELWDAALHQAIAAATHNSFVARVFDLITAVRRQAEWGKLKDRIVTPERRQAYQRQHELIVEALRRRDAEQARAAMLAHLRYARRNLFGEA